MGGADRKNRWFFAGGAEFRPVRSGRGGRSGVTYDSFGVGRTFLTGPTS